MTSRSIITLLLVCAVSLTAAAARTPTAPEHSRFETKEDEPQLSSSDRREALDLLARFGRRLRETNDFGQIVDELFVKDFSERARQAPRNSIPWWLIDGKLQTTAEPLELRRYYVAALNFYQLYGANMEALKKSAPQRADGEEAELDEGAALTPEVMDVLRSDPTIADLIKEFEKDEEDNGAKKDDRNQPAESGDSPPPASATAQADDSRSDDADDDAAEKSDGGGLIKSLAQLKGISDTVERANELMRKRLASLSLNPTPALANNATAKDESRAQNLNLTVVNENFYGCPKGSQVIHADLLPFCLTMIRQNGQLKILAVTTYVD